MAALDIIFDSFGMYILGLVLLFGSYDIALRVRHGHGKKKISLIFSFLFLLTMGVVLFVLSLLFLGRLYADHKVFFYSGIIIFLGVAGVTFQVMKWKHQIMSEDRKMGAMSRSGMSQTGGGSQSGGMPEPIDRSKADHQAKKK